MRLKHFNLVLITILLASCGGDSAVAPEPPEPVDNSIWSQSSPESVGMDSAVLTNAFDQAFVDGTYTQAAVVIKDSKLVYERYRGILPDEQSTLVNELTTDSQTLQNRFGSRDKNSLASSWSTAKSFTSVMIAIAIEQGFIQSVEESASVYITEWANNERAQISIRNLLDMRSGLPILCTDAKTRP